MTVGKIRIWDFPKLGLGSGKKNPDHQTGWRTKVESYHAATHGAKSRIDSWKDPVLVFSKLGLDPVKKNGLSDRLENKGGKLPCGYIWSPIT